MDNSKTGPNRSFPNYLSKSGPKIVYEKKGTKFAFISLIILLDKKRLHLFSLTKSLIWNFTMIVFFQKFHMQ